MIRSSAATLLPPTAPSRSVARPSDSGISSTARRNTVGFGEWRDRRLQRRHQLDSGRRRPHCPGNLSGRGLDRNMSGRIDELPRRSPYLTANLQACSACLQPNNCPGHTGANGGGTQFSFVGRLWAEGIYGHGLGNMIVPPNSPYPYCQFENGDCDMDSGTIIGLTSYHPGGANVCMLDGSVHFLKNSVAYNVIWYLGSQGSGRGRQQRLVLIRSSIRSAARRAPIALSRGVQGVAIAAGRRRVTRRCSPERSAESIECGGNRGDGMQVAGDAQAMVFAQIGRFSL